MSWNGNLKVTSSVNIPRILLTQGNVHYDVFLIGLITTSFLGLLAFVVFIMSCRHCYFHSSRRKQLFHLALLISVLLTLPEAIILTFYPSNETWRYSYASRLFSIMFQCICKSCLAIYWSEVVAAGQTYSHKHINDYVRCGNILLTTCMMVAFGGILTFPDTNIGKQQYLQSIFQRVITYSVIAIMGIYILLLIYQSSRLRRRLLLAKGTVPAGSVEKSLYQLLLTVNVIIVADIIRITAMLLRQYKVEMPVMIYLVLNVLIPTIFPTICMLYLMRRITKPTNTEQFNAYTGTNYSMRSGEQQNQRRRREPVTLSKYMMDRTPTDTRDIVLIQEHDQVHRQHHRGINRENDLELGEHPPYFYKSPETGGMNEVYQDKRKYKRRDHNIDVDQATPVTFSPKSNWILSSR